MTDTSTSHFVKTREATLHYHEFGSGTELIVWLHGGGPGASGISNFRPNLPAFEGYRNLVFDMPAYGLSDKVVITGPRLAYNAAAINAALDELGVERAHFIGNSLGGGTSTKVAIDFPERVDRLILMGAAGASMEDEPLPGIKILIDYTVNGPSREKMREFAHSIVYDSSLLDDEVIEQRYQATLDPEILELNERTGPIQVDDLKPDLGKVRAKTLVLWGREDNFVSLESALAFERGIPDARLFIVPRCGHWFQVERQELFDRMVLGFLRGDYD